MGSQVHRKLRREVMRARGDLVRLTQDLIRVPSPSLHEKEIAHVIDGAMRRLHYDLVFTDDVGNVVGVIAGSVSESPVLVTSHMDTVRPEQVEQWSRFPFSGQMVNGRIHGVGAVSCKGSLASQIHAGSLLASAGVVPRGSVVVAATVADGHGCGVGIRHLLQTTLPDLDLAPTAVVFGGPTAMTVVSGHDGWVAIDVIVHGGAESAVRRVSEQVVRRLGALRQAPESRGGWAVTGVDLLRELPGEGGWRTAIRLDRRVSQDESEGEILNQLRMMMPKRSAESLDVEVGVRVREEEKRLYTGHARKVRLSVPPWSTNLGKPPFEGARTAMRAAGCPWRPDTVEGGRLGFGTAGAIAIHEFGVPAVGFGPGSEVEAERFDESVDIAALSESTYGTAVLMCGLSGTPLVESLGSVQREDRSLVRRSSGVAGR